MGWTISTCGKDQNCVQNVQETPLGVSVKGMIILERIGLL